MPGYDGTGPLGLGMMTGRHLGICKSGKRFNFGRRQWFNENMTKSEEKELLESELKKIEAEKKEIERRLNE